MATFQTQKFIESQRARGVGDEKINEFLKNKGIDATKASETIGATSFFGRLKASFGGAETKRQQDIAERLSGKKGKFELGDIADVAGGALPLIGGILGGAGGTVAGAGVGAVPGAAIGTTAGEAVKRTIGQALGVRKDVTPGQELAGPLLAGAGTAVAGGALSLVGKGVRAAAAPIARGLQKTAEPAKQVAGKVLGKPAEVILGTEKVRGLRAAVAKPELQSKVLAGEITPTTVARKSKQAFQKIKPKSFDALQRSVNKVRGKSDAAALSIKVNQGIANKLGIDSIDDLAQAPTTVESERIITKLTAFLRKNIPEKGTVDKRSLAKIREKIGAQKFFKTAPAGQANPFADSNKVVQAVRDALKEDISIGNKAYASALAKASKDIEFFNKLGVNVLGTNKLRVGQAASKINQLVKEIDDPQVRAELLELIKELEERSGVKLIEEIEAIFAARPFKRDFPGVSNIGETIEQLISKPLAAGIRGAGGIQQGVSQAVGAAKAPIARGVRGVQRVGQAAAGTAVANR